VAIYSPFGARYYSRTSQQSGGAELQTTILARELALRGFRVAHVVYPVQDPITLDAPAPTLIERTRPQSTHRLGALAETWAIWESLRRADAQVYIVRGSGGYLGAATAFCRAYGRQLVFSSSNDLDFDFARPDRSPHILRINRIGIARASRLVVQTRQQRDLARRALPGVDPALIPSFAQPASRTEQCPEYFLWINRLMDYKLPERYIELAQAVPQARFRMLGVTTREASAELVERVRTGAERLPNLELLPELRREELLEQIDRAVAVVTTSRVEGMPNTFLEAWARGVPVLSLSVDPDARIVEQGIGIVADGSMQRFIEAAAELWEDRSARAEMGERARRFVRERHSPAAVAARWDDLLRELLVASPPARGSGAATLWRGMRKRCRRA
jgi:glycosyltransferase involved in cell wall biosynthesis